MAADISCVFENLVSVLVESPLPVPSVYSSRLRDHVRSLSRGYENL